jgi:nucleoside-diphosphate-sugar epimerase
MKEMNHQHEHREPHSISLVTGAAGFVGSWLVRHLCDLGHPVRAMVRNHAKTDQLRAWGAEVVVADIKDKDSLLAAVQGCDRVYHIAALFRQAGLPDSEYHAVNVQGVRNVFDTAIEAGVRRIVHCSTVGVLGGIKDPPGTEETPYNPGDIYQQTKMEGELIALDYFKQNLISGLVIRPAMIYGPGDERTLKLFKMIARRRFFFVGDGSVPVHWIDVRDLARSFVLAMEEERIHGEVFIIAGRKSLPLKEMCNLVAEMLGVPPPRLHLPVKPVQMLGSLCEAVCTPLRIQPPIYRRRVDFFTKPRQFDWSKARRELGFEPDKDLRGELQDILNHYKQLGML